MNFVPNADSVGEVQYARAGHYFVGDKKFYNNYQAFEYAKKTGGEVKWYFYDDVWDNAHRVGNWKQQTLDQLYDLRAKQLRQQYDHITILSSGGWDSRNVVEVFERNGLHIDCILTQVVPELNSTTSSTNFAAENWNGEILYHAEPFAVQYVKRHPKTLFLRHEWINEAEKALRDPELLITTSHCRVGLTATRFTSMAKNPTLLDITKNKNACIISGADKPCIVLNGDAAMGFIPEGIIRHLNWFCSASKGWPPNIIHENFYWTPELPELVVRGWYELLALCARDPLVRQAHSLTETLPNRMIRKSSIPVQNSMRKMLYRGFDPNAWQAKKPTGSSFFFELDLPVLSLLESRNVHVKSVMGEALVELSKMIGEENAVFANKPLHDQKFWVDRCVSDDHTMVDYKSLITKCVDLDSTFQLTQENYF